VQIPGCPGGDAQYRTESKFKRSGKKVNAVQESELYYAQARIINLINAG